MLNCSTAYISTFPSLLLKQTFGLMSGNRTRKLFSLSALSVSYVLDCFVCGTGMLPRIAYLESNRSFRSSYTFEWKFKHFVKSTVAAISFVVCWCQFVVSIERQKRAQILQRLYCSPDFKFPQIFWHFSKFSKFFLCQRMFSTLMSIFPDIWKF